MSCVNLFAREGHVGLGTDARAIYFDDFFPSIRIFIPNKRKVSFISSFDEFLKIFDLFKSTKVPKNHLKQIEKEGKREWRGKGRIARTIYQI